jgi:hypothetical protein
MRMSEMERILTRIRKANPGFEVRDDGTKHLKMYLNGTFLGILPRKCAKEGLAYNTKCQLKRAGVKI